MKRDFIIAIAVILVVAGATYGISTVRPELPPSHSTPFSLATGAKPVGNEKVVMRVNGEPVTERDFQIFLTQAPEQAQAFYASPEGRRQLAQQLVRFKVLEQEGRRLGVEQDADVAARANFDRAAVIASAALRKIAGVPTDQQVRDEYQRTLKNFDTIDMSHIVVSYQGGMVPPRQGEALPVEVAMKKAQALAAQLKNGTDFSTLAARESDDAGSASQGGYIGPVTRGSLPPEIEPTIFALREGEISPPVRSSFGIHIFKAGARKTQSFEETKSALRERMQQTTLETRVNELQRTAKVDLDPKYFPNTGAAPSSPPQ